ncbi:protein phosphatase 2C domain-containing protein [Naumannella huperziae]
MTKPAADAGVGAAPPTCPGCGAEVSPHESFCESCGHELDPTERAPERGLADAPINLSRSVRAHSVDLGFAGGEHARTCADCGGAVDVEGWCEVCGAKAPRARDRFGEAPADWLAGTSDLGVRHHRNEDALALAADDRPGSRGVLVVCDGVSTAPDSDRASLAAARAARDLMASTHRAGLGTAESRDAALVQLIVDAVATANAAVLGTAEDPAGADSAASCTFSAAMITDGLVTWGNLGDSRSYWLPDEGEPTQLSTDDSVAQARIAMGVDREEAENSPGAHAITKWLGADAPDLAPQTGQFRVPGPGWLLVCSDGLWNYASAADDLEAVVAELILADPARNHAPLRLSELLVEWARERGGRDNITAALARFGPQQWSGPTLAPPAVEASPLDPESDQATRPTRYAPDAPAGRRLTRHPQDATPQDATPQD